MPVPAVAELLDFVLRLIDRFVSPETRQNVSQRVREFAAARPLLFSFIVTQATFSAMPIFFFVLASIFSILTIVSTALIFLVLFWTGFAITVIAPILLISSAFALFFWAFGVVLFTAGSSALA
ncbi:hypothetical protein NEMBOFW57_005733 [Staphylotrichum longicolle]|uniref:Uncharacterized protein n=1 Tax=Staphylotrichum longicolle TaxID=669026 RepID=A0AAD4HZZ1_9PEZI|nr:hypothetical protein NEMBOFW57_005733 [Staphylotrichum longicolle]